MKQFGESDLNEFNYDTCCTIFRHLIEQVEKENKVRANHAHLAATRREFFASQEREKSQPTSRVLLNSTRTPLLVTANPNKLPENNFMDSLMTELKQRKFATAPRPRRPRRGLFDDDERDVK